MTWSLTLAGLPGAGAYSKPHHYKQKLQKKRDFLKTLLLTGKQFEKFRSTKSSIPVFAWRTKQRKHKTPKAKIEHEPCSQEEID